MRASFLFRVLTEGFVAGNCSGSLWEHCLLWHRAERLPCNLLSAHWHWQWALECHPAIAHRCARLHCNPTSHLHVSPKQLTPCAVAIPPQKSFLASTWVTQVTHHKPVEAAHTHVSLQQFTYACPVAYILLLYVIVHKLTPALLISAISLCHACFLAMLLIDTLLRPGQRLYMHATYILQYWISALATYLCALPSKRSCRK